ASLVHGIVALGHSLELAVVGEGVERLDQAEALAGLRCDLGQGFLYGRPMAAADLPLVQTEPALNPPIRVRAQSALPAPVAPGDA
ncbi:MAG TPA: EAL domain-containing protein, partial [Candidatus Limnocylindrales bacterium]|nr:EAL domain-containing protein [Candidatus Limnocylindrales bacterium]